MAQVSVKPYYDFDTKTYHEREIIKCAGLKRKGKL